MKKRNQKQKAELLTFPAKLPPTTGQLGNVAIRINENGISLVELYYQAKAFNPFWFAIWLENEEQAIYLPMHHKVIHGRLLLFCEFPNFWIKGPPGFFIYWDELPATVHTAFMYARDWELSHGLQSPIELEFIQKEKQMLQLIEHL